MSNSNPTLVGAHGAWHDTATWRLLARCLNDNAIPIAAQDMIGAIDERVHGPTHTHTWATKPLALPRAARRVSHHPDEDCWQRELESRGSPESARLMLEIILYGLRTIAVLFALSRAQAPARQSEEHVMRDRFRVTEVLRPRLGQDEFFVRIAIGA